MIIAGAGGHAKEVLGVLTEQAVNEEIYFYDDLFVNKDVSLFSRYTILRTQEEVRAVINNDPRFVLGIGNPVLRYQIAQRFLSLGGELTSVISGKASVGSFNVHIGVGLNIMQGAVVTEDVSVGDGVLVHVHASIHHDCVIGDYCEVLPGSHVLGKVQLGNFTSVGSGAIILPKVRVGANVVIGAGAVVTRDVPDGAKIKGVPAK